MARIRSIKPQLWSSTQFKKCSMLARLCFIGIISFADDEGRLPFDLERLHTLIFPNETVEELDLFEWVHQLQDNGLIYMYEDVTGFGCIQVCKFSEHQKLSKVTQSKLPAPDNTALVEFIRQATVDSQKTASMTYSRKLDSGYIGNGYGKFRKITDRYGKSTLEMEMEMEEDKDKDKELTPIAPEGERTKATATATAHSQEQSSAPQENENFREGRPPARTLALQLMRIRYPNPDALADEMEHLPGFELVFQGLLERKPFTYWQNLLEKAAVDPWYRDKQFGHCKSAAALLKTFSEKITKFENDLRNTPKGSPQHV